ncbi:hypothetical protein [Polyangium sp. 6x1]|uniref:hypothetical protein n=1 Tax=Polyangium sp. 6x1 TaxID=3042689 RepID=UPI00248247CB|nr:hypothetical protein [Polyangium sp. 6x1]MDI1443841.1 hypothetical protein [Polyangium sp. 6x1]
MNDELALVPRPLTWPERLFLRLLRWMELKTFGFKHPFSEELVRSSGFVGALNFGKAVGKAMGGLEKRYGLLVSNLIMGFAGLWNGCRYCGVGHLYAANLLHFKATGRLYPIAESDVPWLQELSYDESMVRVRGMLADEEFDEHLRIIERLYGLRGGAEAQNEEDRLLQLALASWAWLNECSAPITFDMQVQDVPAILEKTERGRILERYRAARDARSRKVAARATSLD